MIISLFFLEQTKTDILPIVLQPSLFNTTEIHAEKALNHAIGEE
jgi:hypothetical protein